MEGRERKHILQKQFFADVLQNRCSSKSRHIHGKLPMLEFLFNNVAGLQACNFIKKRLQQTYFPVNLAKF